jgi:hypothetical protein
MFSDNHGSREPARRTIDGSRPKLSGTPPAGRDVAGSPTPVASALGGVAMHPLSFGGPEIKPVTGANSVNLEEGTGQGQTPTDWISHPAASGIGYRRASPGVASASGQSAIPPSAGNQPNMDTGTSDGSMDQELARVSNFDRAAKRRRV